MKIYLDDERETPPGWVRAYWPDEVIVALEQGGVGVVSLDHDLGDDQRGTGYDVVLWIENAVATRGFLPPEIRVHSANSSACHKMLLGIENIDALVQKRNTSIQVLEELSIDQKVRVALDSGDEFILSGFERVDESIYDRGDLIVAGIDEVLVSKFRYKVGTLIELSLVDIAEVQDVQSGKSILYC